MLTRIKDFILLLPGGERLVAARLRVQAAARRPPQAPPVGYRVDEAGVSDVPESAHGGKPLPDGLRMSPGRYAVFGRTWDCAEPGLYRFCLPHAANAQRVVPDPGSAPRTALLLALALGRGNRDDHLPHADALAVAAKGFAIMTCGPASAFVARELRDAGLSARVVGGRADAPANGYADGHVLVEAGAGYELVDVDGKARFTDSDGRGLNLVQVCRALAEGEPPGILRAAVPDVVDWTHFSGPGGYGYGFLDYRLRRDAAARDAEALRLLALPWIREGREVAYTCHAGWRDAPEPGWRWLAPAEFERRFYAQAQGGG